MTACGMGKATSISTLVSLDCSSLAEPSAYSQLTIWRIVQLEHLGLTLSHLSFFVRHAKHDLGTRRLLCTCETDSRTLIFPIQGSLDLDMQRQCTLFIKVNRMNMYYIQNDARRRITAVGPMTHFQARDRKRARNDRNLMETGRNKPQSHIPAIHRSVPPHMHDTYPKGICSEGKTGLFRKRECTSASETHKQMTNGHPHTLPSRLGPPLSGRRNGGPTAQAQGLPLNASLRSATYIMSTGLRICRSTYFSCGVFCAVAHIYVLLFFFLRVSQPSLCK